MLLSNQELDDARGLCVNDDLLVLHAYLTTFEWRRRLNVSIDRLTSHTSENMDRGQMVAADGEYIPNGRGCDILVTKYSDNVG